MIVKRMKKVTNVNAKSVKVWKCCNNLTAGHFSNLRTRASSKLCAYCAIWIHFKDFLKIEINLEKIFFRQAQDYFFYKGFLFLEDYKKKIFAQYDYKVCYLCEFSDFQQFWHLLHTFNCQNKWKKNCKQYL